MNHQIENDRFCKNCSCDEAHEIEKMNEEVLRSYISKRIKKMESMISKAETTKEKDMHFGEDMQIEYEGRLDELACIWNKYSEKGD